MGELRLRYSWVYCKRHNTITFDTAELPLVMPLLEVEEMLTDLSRMFFGLTEFMKRNAACPIEGCPERDRECEEGLVDKNGKEAVSFVEKLLEEKINE